MDLFDLRQSRDITLWLINTTAHQLKKKKNYHQASISTECIIVALLLMILEPYSSMCWCF